MEELIEILKIYYEKCDECEKQGFVSYMAEAFKRYAIVQRNAARMQERAFEKLREVKSHESN